MLALFYLNDSNSKKTKRLFAESSSENYTEDKKAITSELKKIHSFKSSFNDKEYITGGLIQTNNEITYHVLDFPNKKVTCYAPVRGEYIIIEISHEKLL